MKDEQVVNLTIDDMGFNVGLVKTYSEDQFVNTYKNQADAFALEPGEKAEDRIGRIKSAYKQIKDFNPSDEVKSKKTFKPITMEPLVVSVVPNA